MKCAKRWLLGVVASAALLLGACSSTIGPPEVQGHPAMVDAAGTPTLWVLTKREESKQVSVGGSRRSAGSTRSDTFFHFQLQAIDPVTTRPLWSKRLLTLGDPDARGTGPSRVIGSAAGAQLIGQEGERVWMFIDDQLLALNATDGNVLADVALIEQHNPTLKGLLPSDARQYSFDHGLVFMSADARPMVVRGSSLKAEPYQPTPTAMVEPTLKANGMPVIVPMVPPIGEIPARQVRLGGEWLGLYSPKEAADAANDRVGNHLLYPYTVLDELSRARRSFWRAHIVNVQDFEEHYDRLESLTPVADSSVFLRGRFLKDPSTREPRLLKNPDGVAIWHVTRIDSEGRLAVSRVGTDLRTIWTATLPLSDNSISNPMQVWHVADRVVVSGNEESLLDGVTRRQPHLISISLVDGSWKGWNIESEAAIE